MPVGFFGFPSCAGWGMAEPSDSMPDQQEGSEKPESLHASASSPALLGPVEVRRLLASCGARPSRFRGQNFLIDPNTVRRIVRLSDISPGDKVLEVGVGLGCLTLGLLAAGAHVLGLEVDERLAAVAPLPAGTVDLRVMDALDADWSVLLAESAASAAGQAPERGGEQAGEHIEGRVGEHVERHVEGQSQGQAAGQVEEHAEEHAEGQAGGQADWKMISNLPYSVGTRILLDIVVKVPQVSSFLVMVQREVGERLVAQPGMPAYGASSVKVAHFCTVRLEGSVPPSVFYPRPEVDSVLVRLERHPRFSPTRKALPASLRRETGSSHCESGSGSAPSRAPSSGSSAGLSPGSFPGPSEAKAALPEAEKPADSSLVFGESEESVRAFFRVVDAGFGQRRKTLRKALRAVFPLEQVEDACAKAGIDPRQRAETLSSADFLRLSQFLQ